MTDLPPDERTSYDTSQPGVLCEQLLDALYDGLLKYFLAHGHIPVERGSLKQAIDGRCGLEVIFHLKTDLKYELCVSIEGGRAILQVQSDTIQEKATELQDVEITSTQHFEEQARPLYEAIEMDIQRIIYTNS